MKWKKLGKIFDPRDWKLANNCELFAQSPQALLFDNFIRIYFSTRCQDNGKFLSHISFVDMEKNLKKIIRVSDKTVIPLGDLGTFDEHGIFPMNVMRQSDKVYGYICGWNRRVSVSVDTAIGLAISRDEGLTFQRFGSGPVLAASLNEPFLVGDGFVREFNGKFHMWYIFGTGWKRYDENSAPDRTYKIGYATSYDAIKWVKNEGVQIVPDKLGPDESQALPSVVKIDDTYHMFFCYRQSFDFRQAKGRGYQLGHAWSIDLENWNRADDNPVMENSEDSWDSDMVCYPQAFNLEGRTYLLYNGNEFGKFGFGAAVLEYE